MPLRVWIIFQLQPHPGLLQMSELLPIIGYTRKHDKYMLKVRFGSIGVDEGVQQGQYIFETSGINFLEFFVVI
jgi:hypothetical protein